MGNKQEEIIKYKIADLCAKNNPNLLRSEEVNRIVSYILNNQKCYSMKNTFSTNEIKQAYQKLKKKHQGVFDIPENSLSTYTCWLANDSDSQIATAGKKKGYYLNFGSLYDPNTGKEIKSLIDEKDMYPILTEWLSCLSERVDDISNIRKRGQWTNPDILGINHSVFFGNNMIELTTIEAKRNLANWRINFFEAVAHSMFANKSYYAFLRRQSDKIEKDLFLYAQKFGIGLISIEIPDEEWNNNLNLKLEYVKEIFPAPIHNVSVIIQKKFLNNLGIIDITHIQKFGKTNSDFT